MFTNNQSLEQVQVAMDKMAQAPNLYNFLPQNLDFATKII
jgi:hypothetical protein